MINWKETTLGEACKILSGSTPSTEDSSFWDGNISWITPKDLSGFNGTFIEKGERNITEAGLRNSSAQLLTPNTILFSSRAPIGYVAIAKKELTTNQGFKNIVCDEKITHFQFIYYWLKFKSNLIEKRSSGSTFSEASASLMRSLEIDLPPIEEQKEIAGVLSSLDDKIELLREKNKTLEATAQTIFKEWFVNFNFPNIEGKSYKSSGGKMIDSEIGEIPEGWRAGKLGEEVKIVMGQSPSGESYNENENGEVFFQGRTDFSDRFPQVRLYTTEPKRMAERFDVLVSVRAPVGDINVASERCCIGRGLAAVRSDYKSYALYKIKSLKDAFNKFEAEGTVFGSINKDSFLNIEALIPATEVVKSFDGFANSLDEKIFNNYSQIQNLSTLRDTLLPKLMNGELKIRN